MLKCKFILSPPVAQVELIKELFVLVFIKVLLVLGNALVAVFFGTLLVPPLVCRSSWLRSFCIVLAGEKCLAFLSRAP